MKRLLIPVCILFLLHLPSVAQDCGSPPVSSQNEEPGDGIDYDDLDELNSKLENPLSKVWSLVFQDNVNLNKGDGVEGTHTGNTFFFQPFLPVPVKGAVLSVRPVFPIVTTQILDSTSPTGVSSRTTGFGDIQVLSLIGPDRADGVVWGVGSTFRFPTASSSATGAGKHQVGPAGLLFYSGKKWVAGIVAQQWWSVAGDETRAGTSSSEFQYIIRRRVPGAMSLGVGPPVTVNWKAPDGEKLTFPAGFGVVKMVRAGKMPVKLKAEVHYNVVRPSYFATAWTFRFQVTPVIRSPFL